MKKTIKDFDLKGKNVIIRCDLNVPLKDGIITNDARIKASLESLNYLVENKAKIILLSHLGRIKCEEDKKDKSLKVVAEELKKYFGNLVFVNKTRGTEVEDAINNLNEGEIVLLENTRFEDFPDKKESKKDSELSSYWANLGEIFINDAFATAHRSHASNVGISQILPSGIGFLVEKELETINKMLMNPERPFVVIMGGAKVGDKIPVIENLIDKVDKLVICGGMAYSFYKALGFNIGNSICDEECINFCRKLYDEYKEKIILPVDNLVTSEFIDTKDYKVVDYNKIGEKMMGMDIGPKTLELYEKIFSEVKDVIWNGPCGVFEFENFAKGTKGLGKILIKSNCNVIVGGGDSAAAVYKFGFENSFSHICTGGGALLNMLEGKELTAISAITNKGE